MKRRKWFLIWLTVLTAVWGIANLPRNGGTLKPFLQWAGFPWVFASWQSGRLEWFDPTALAGDVIVGSVIVVITAWLCTWTRGISRPTATSTPVNRADDPRRRPPTAGVAG